MVEEDGKRAADARDRWRLAVALLVALALHGAVAIILLGVRKPAARPPMVMVGFMAPAPVPEAEPAPPAPVPPTPSPVAKPRPRSTPVPMVSKPAPAADAAPALAPLEPSPPAAAESAPTAVPMAPAPSANAQPVATPPSFQADYLSNPRPAYPLLSRKLREEGLVRLRVRVTAEGKPESVEVHHGSGYLRLDMAATAAVRQWRFVPARRAGLAVAEWVEVPIKFDLEN